MWVWRPTSLAGRPAPPECVTGAERARTRFTGRCKDQLGGSQGSLAQACCGRIRDSPVSVLGRSGYSGGRGHRSGPRAGWNAEERCRGRIPITAAWLGQEAGCRPAQRSRAVNQAGESKLDLPTAPFCWDPHPVGLRPRPHPHPR